MIELTGALMLAITPWLLKTFTNAIKAITAIKLSQDKVFIVRFMLAVLTIAAATLKAMLSGDPVPETAIEQFVDAVTVFVEAGILWLSTTGLYELGRKRR